MQPDWQEQQIANGEAAAAEPGDGAGERPVSRRGFLQGSLAGLAAGLAARSMFEAHATAHAAPAETPAAQGETPIGPIWWPSRWGPDDQAGASNWMTPGKTLEAAGLIRSGRIFELGRVYEAGMPLFGARAFTVRIPGAPTGGPFGGNRLVYHDEFISTEIGQVGTQFDGLGHIGCQVGAPGDQANMRYYNGFTELEIATANGLLKLGIENVKPIFTRGMLLDIAAVRGGMMDAGQEVSAADVQGAMARQGLSEASLTPGDAIFFNTGWGSLWMQNNDRFNAGAPGIGLEVARWAAAKSLAVVGSDTWCVEAVPNPNPNLVFAVHNELITREGIFLHENLDFTELLAAGVSEFVYVMAPLRIKGATGSPGRPIAIT